MDILGYVEICRRAERENQSQELLGKLYGALKNTREWLEEKNLEVESPTEVDRFALRAFTDNIVIGWPISSSSRNAAGSVLRHAMDKVSQFQMDMALRGFFVRGAISVGDVYIDDIAVFGPAHLNAYEAEQKQAITPRVILANSAVEAACEYQATYPESESNPLSQRVRLDSDDLRFVNYLDFASHDVTLITQHRDIVSTKYQEHEADLRIQSKYCWVAKYHNNFCAEHSEKFGQLNIPFL